MPEQERLLEIPPDGVIGELSDQAKIQMSMFQSKTRELQMQIGQLEVRKTQIIRDLDRLNAEAQAIVNAEAKRLGIPTGVSWQITPDGKVRVIPGKEPSPPPVS